MPGMAPRGGTLIDDAARGPRGRERIFAELVRRLDEPAPEAQIVELVGEAGIGKTHLLDHLASAAAAREIVVLRGRASEFERDVPFAPVIDALGTLPHGLGDDADSQHRHAVHASVRGMLERQGRRKRLLVILDDLHWADAASIDLIRALAARPPAAPILLVVAHRPHQYGSAMRRAALAAIGPYAAARIELDGLGVDDASALMPDGTPARAVRTAHAACGGNPFALVQLGREAARTGTFDAGAAAGEHAVAQPLAALLASELGVIPASARRLLDGAAVAGDPFDLGLAATIADCTEEEALAALDELTAADLVRATEQPRRFAFRHPLVRQCAYEACSPAWRLQAHERAARRLRADGAGALALANHVAQSARPGDAEAIATLTEAGRQVAARSPRSAAHWYGAAWALVREAEHGDPEHVELLYALGLALTVSGAGHRALTLASPPLERRPATDPVRLRFELGLASIHQTLGQLPKARERVRALQAEIGAAPSFEAFIVATAFASMELHCGNHEPAREQAARALDIAEHLGIAPLTDMVRATSVWAAMVAGDYAEAEAAYGATAHTFDALADAARIGEPALMAGLAAAEHFPVLLVVVARAERHLGHFDAAVRHAQDGLHATRRGSWPVLATVFLAGAALAELELGRLQQASALAGAAEEEAAMINHREADHWANAARCAVLEPTDRLGDAIEAGERALAAAAQHAVLPDVMGAGVLLARALIAADLPLRAIAVLEGIGGPGGRDVLAPWRAEHARLLADAELRRGDLSAARGWARHAAAHAQGRLAELDAMAADAACLLAEGDAVGAAARAGAAATAAREIGARLTAARLDLLTGRAFAAANERPHAAQALRRAESECTSMGAERLRAEAVRALRSMGLRVVATGRSTTAREPLTARQQEIASLAAAGLSNRAIAEQLFLSIKTIETHLAAAFVKLGVSARAELADALAADR